MTEQYMTQSECDRKHKVTRMLMSTVLALCALFVAMNGWSLAASHSATARAAQAAADLAVIATGQERDIKHLQGAVDELKFEIRALRTILERIGRTGSVRLGTQDD